jgi:DNA-binding CsgD family transcriptional regulator
MRAASFEFAPSKTPYPREYPADLIEQAFACYRAGTTTIRELARTSHVTEATIRQWFAAAGEPIRQKGWRRLTVSDERLLELAGQGLTQRQIGQIVGLSDKGVGYRPTRIRTRCGQSC